MDTLHIEATKYTPSIDLNTDGSLSFIGKSYPENTFEFYTPVIAWLEEFLSSPPSDTVNVKFDISYFNSSSSKLFFDLFDLLEANRDKSNIAISWIYDEENESAEEAGEDFIDDFQNLNITLQKR
jgi:hypothetical protein